MSVPYEKIVEEDLNLGSGVVDVTMPGGGTAVGHQIGPHTFQARVFSASLGAVQSVDAAVEVIEIDTEEVDTDGWFDATTYTFQPTQSGIYLIQGQVGIQAFTGLATVYLYRGASEVARQDAARTTAAATIQVSTLLSLNGSTDTVTLRVNHSHGSARNVTAASFSGMLIYKLDV